MTECPSLGSKTWQSAPPRSNRPNDPHFAWDTLDRAWCVAAERLSGLLPDRPLHHGGRLVERRLQLLGVLDQDQTTLGTGKTLGGAQTGML